MQSNVFDVWILYDMKCTIGTDNSGVFSTSSQVSEIYLISIWRTRIHNDNLKKSIQRTQTPSPLSFNLWPWDMTLVKKVYVIRCRLLYFTLIPCKMSLSVIVCEIWPFLHFLWPRTFACDLHRPSRSLSFISLDRRYVVVYWFQVWSL